LDTDLAAIFWMLPASRILDRVVSSALNRNRSFPWIDLLPLSLFMAFLPQACGRAYVESMRKSWSSCLDEKVWRGKAVYQEDVSVSKQMKRQRTPYGPPRQIGMAV
jgi:hypothetical protein